MHAIIIGSGIAGIASSIRLAKKGYSVSVYEANSYPGGKLTSLTLGGYRFDAGPSLFTMPHFVDELLALSNNQPDFSYLKKDIVCAYFFDDDSRFTAFSDKENYLSAVEETFDIDRNKVSDYLKNAKDKSGWAKTTNPAFPPGFPWNSGNRSSVRSERCLSGHLVQALPIPSVSNSILDDQSESMILIFHFS